GRALGKLVRPSQMSGEKGDRKFAGIIHDHYGRVPILPLQERCSQPDDNPGSHDADEALDLLPESLEKLFQLALDRDCTLAGSAHIFRECIKLCRRKSAFQAGSQTCSVSGYGDNGDFHCEDEVNPDRCKLQAEEMDL